jgi:Uma2 family endonuclease
LAKTNAFISIRTSKFSSPEIRTYTYPDAAIACPPTFDEGPTAALLNPKVLFEVLSPSTEGDRGMKFRNYRRIPTIEEYVLIDSNEFVVEIF